jgi:uncharacterized protein (DUF2252 family)
MSELSERLKIFNAGLLPEKVQLKYEAMAENTFRFYRGTCHLFYDALADALPLSPLAGLICVFVI